MNFEGAVKVQFGVDVDSDAYIAYFKLDDESNGIISTDDNGVHTYKRSFAPGESVVFQAHFSGNVQIDAVAITDGDLEHIGQVSRELEVEHLFISRTVDKESTFTLPIVPRSTTVTSYGKTAYGTIEALFGGMRKYIGDINETPFHAIFSCTYNTALYRLTCPDYDLEDGESWPITVVFYATLLEEGS